MSEAYDIWTAQCEAATEIRERFGDEKALGYLIGEKLAMFLRYVDQRADFAEELPAFVAEIRARFEPALLSGFLGRLRRLGAFAHIGSEAEIESMRKGGMFGEPDPVAGAEDVLLIERIRELLLP